MRTVNMNPIRSVDRAVDILLAFSADKYELNIDELSEITQIPNSTVYRILCTLERRSLVQFNESTMKYKPGVQLFALGSLTPYALDVREEAEEILEDIYEKTGQTIIMAVPDGDEIIYVYKKEKNHGLKFSSSIGQRRPYTYGVLGPNILAFLPKTESDRILEKPRASYTTKTETDNSVMRKRMERIRETKLYVESDETTLGVTGVGAPVFDMNGEVIAAIGALGPTVYIEDQMDLVKELIHEGGNKISQKMGFHS
ncbi:IclR family transcriptional regulator [Salibacterium aidingense]|uniref:IclR family transcriptional regulator n=1 Tax=Salibacterium aidingense TaxID=384933 RepID=UPI000426BCDC|nr:IclR family transcriptional regulator [Salibacterium aidingense]